MFIDFGRLKADDNKGLMIVAFGQLITRKLQIFRSNLNYPSPWHNIKTNIQLLSIFSEVRVCFFWVTFSCKECTSSSRILVTNWCLVKTRISKEKEQLVTNTNLVLFKKLKHVKNQTHIIYGIFSYFHLVPSIKYSLLITKYLKTNNCKNWLWLKQAYCLFQWGSHDF